MNLTALKLLWSQAFDRIGHYERRLRAVAAERPWFIPMYHRILRDDEPDPFDLGLGVRRRHFERHLAYFRERFHVCTVQQALQSHASGQLPDRPLLSITFDDGYLDNVELALPLLRAHGCTATFFICTGPIAEQRAFWWDIVLASAGRRGEAHWQSLLERVAAGRKANAKADLHRVLSALWSMRYSEIAALVHADGGKAGGALDALCPPRMQREHVALLLDHGMEVAAHTHNHPNLTKESDATIREEIASSKRLLETWTGRPVTGFATPHGFVDDRVTAACDAEGIAYVASTDRGANREVAAYHLARFGVADAPVAHLKRSLTRMLD